MVRWPVKADIKDDDDTDPIEKGAGECMGCGVVLEGTDRRLTREDSIETGSCFYERQLACMVVFGRLCRAAGGRGADVSMRACSQAGDEGQGIRPGAERLCVLSRVYTTTVSHTSGMKSGWVSMGAGH